MKKNLLLTSMIAAGITLASLCAADAIGQKAGTTSGEFLRLGAGARATGMGEAFAAVADDVYSLYWNPAGLTQVEDHQALLAHTMWYMDVNHEYAAYCQSLPGNWGKIGLSVTYLMTTFEKREGDTDSADSNGNIGDMAAGLSYARTLPGAIEGGITLKYISSTLDDYTAVSPAVDLGFQKTLPYLGQRITLGLAVLNLGGSLKFIDDAVAIGNTADLGVAIQDAGIKNLLLAADYRTLLNGSSDSVNAGAEYVINAGKDISVAPRVGFESQNSQLTAGFGIGWKGYQLDYAFVPHADLGTANRISLQLHF
jgi:hypothetical protein